MSDITTSLKEIFNERISSPFYGSLIVSWLLWNWKIPYVTFFVDQDKLVDCTNKIDYILKHCSNPLLLILFPLLSTALILLVMPYITNGASWVTERFDTWRVNKKNEVRGKRLLTVEESLKLRLDIRNQEEEFNKLFTKKDEEIKSLKLQLNNVLNQPSVKKQKINIEETYKEELEKFLKNGNLVKHLETIAEKIRTGYSLRDIPIDIVNYYEGYELVEPLGSNYVFTEKGKYFLKEYLRRKTDKLK